MKYRASLYALISFGMVFAGACRSPQPSNPGAASKSDTAAAPADAKGGTAPPATTTPPAPAAAADPGRSEAKPQTALALHKGPPADVAAAHAALDAHIASYGRHLGDAAKFRGFVGIYHQGKPWYERGTCCIDAAGKQLPDGDTNFRIGSVTKQFTATAIMLLVAEGKLSLDDTIGKHLPKYPAVGRDITVRQLLSHTSGIPSYTDMPEVMDRRARAMSPATLMKTFWDKPLKFAPGSKFSYSNSGYVVLGALIEKVAAMPFEKFLALRVLAPAGLKRTLVGDAKGLPNRAEGFTVDSDTGKVKLAQAISMTIPYAAGAVRATARDLAAWVEAVSHGKVVSAEVWQQMTTPVVEDYGLGWVRSELDGFTRINHGGGIDGFSTELSYFPEAELVIVAWSNNDTVPAAPVAKAAWQAWRGHKVAPAPEVPVFDLPEATVAKFAGRFALSEESRKAAAALGLPADILDSVASLQLERAGKSLKVTPVGQGTFVVTATAATEFENPRLRITLEFAEDGTKVTLIQGGLSMTYLRVP